MRAGRDDVIGLILVSLSGKEREGGDLRRETSLWRALKARPERLAFVWEAVRSLG